MDRFRLHKALEIIWKVVGDANRYFASQEPWALKKTDPERMNTVLYTTAEVIRVVATRSTALHPRWSSRSCSTCCASTKRSGSSGVSQAALVPGTELPKPHGVFPRYVDETADA
jgi:methionyl-tRNA synthetase